MQYLTTLIVLLLVGCSKHEHNWTRVDVRDLKLKAGQKVKTNIPFYSDCVGIIEDFARIYDRNTEQHEYKIQFDCINDISIEEGVWVREIYLSPAEE